MNGIQRVADEDGESIAGDGNKKVQSPEVGKGGIWKLLELRNAAFHCSILMPCPVVQ